MHTVFDTITAALDQLTLLLEDEAERLKRRNIDDLELLLSNKQSMLQTIAQADQERLKLLRAANVNDDAAGMRDYLSQQSDPALQSRWQNIVAQLQHVQILNEANGRIIQRGLDQTSQMLNLLRGGTFSSDAPSYGPGGKPPSSGSRSLSRA